MSGGGSSPRHHNDVESGVGDFEEDYESVSDPFDIVRTKSASVDRLRRWRAPATMEVPNAAETNGATTSSFLQYICIVTRFFYLPKLRDAATSLAGGLWGGAFPVQEEEETDLEAGAPEAAGETHVQTMFRTTSIEQFETPMVKKLMPTFLCFTLPGLLCLAQIKWQLAPHGFPSSTLHKWYLICVTSLLTEFAASVVQWIISAACGPMDHREPRNLKPDTSHSATTTLCACQFLIFY